MYCKYCGNKIAEGASFCSACGSAVEIEAKAPDYAFAAATESATDPELEERKNAHARKILTLGICSVAFASTGILSIVAIILACICRSNIREYERLYGSTTGMASVGKGLSIGGLIGGIALTVFLAIYFLIMFIVIIAAIGLGTYDSVEFASSLIRNLLYYL